MQNNTLGRLGPWKLGPWKLGPWKLGPWKKRNSIGESQVFRRFYLKGSIRLFIGIASGMLLLLAPARLQAQEDTTMRTWKSCRGQHKIRAKLLDFDTDSDSVRLETSEGRTITVDSSKLSLTDREYLERLANHRDESNPFLVEATTSGGASAADGNGGEADVDDIDNKELKNIARRQEPKFGIRWSGQLDDALRIAQGKPQSNDDRPVMWFRVLGDLDGFM